MTGKGQKKMRMSSVERGGQGTGRGRGRRTYSTWATMHTVRVLAHELSDESILAVLVQEMRTSVRCLLPLMLSRLRPRLRLPVPSLGALPARCFASASREPTIFAPATGRGKCAISILRISGPDALEVWRRMTGPPRTQRGKAPASPRERRAVLRSIVHPETKEVLDEGIVLYFPRRS